MPQGVFAITEQRDGVYKEMVFFEKYPLKPSARAGALPTV